MAKEKEEIMLEREYIIPLRREWLRVSEYRRTPRAVKAIKKFLARHMKIYDRDLRKIKIDKYLNQELWFRGIRNPPSKIKIKAKKIKIEGEEIVRVELAEIPQIIKFQIEREKRRKDKQLLVKAGKTREEKKEKPEEKEEETKEEVKEKEEKKEAVEEAGLKMAQKQAKQVKHEVVGKKIQKQPLARKALQK